MTRDEAARRFADLAKIPLSRRQSEKGTKRLYFTFGTEEVDLPPPDAPLPVALAFVGWVAGAVKPKWRLSLCGWWGESEFHVGFDRPNGDSGSVSIEDCAEDPAHAALLAACAALEER